MNKSPFLETALHAVKEAEKVIRKYYSPDIRASLKADTSPVTIADKESEEIIIRTIREAFPDHSFFGEESGKESKEAEYRWIIDPIDGTKNYMRTIPLFGTQLALMKGTEIILGISNAPMMNELLYAEKGQGAYCNDKKIMVSQISDMSKAYLCFGGIVDFVTKNHMEGLININKGTAGHRGIGDCYCYHLLAQGKIDIMLEAKVKIWDIAAAACILREAGGKITDIQGNEITTETHTIAATNGLLHEAVLNYFK